MRSSSYRVNHNPTIRSPRPFSAGPRSIPLSAMPLRYSILSVILRVFQILLQLLFIYQIFNHISQVTALIDSVHECYGSGNSCLNVVQSQSPPSKVASCNSCSLHSKLYIFNDIIQRSIILRLQVPRTFFGIIPLTTNALISPFWYHCYWFPQSLQRYWRSRRSA